MTLEALAACAPAELASPGRAAVAAADVAARQKAAMGTPARRRKAAADEAVCEAYFASRVPESSDSKRYDPVLASPELIQQSQRNASPGGVLASLDGNAGGTFPPMALVTDEGSLSEGAVDDSGDAEEDKESKVPPRRAANPLSMMTPRCTPGSGVAGPANGGAAAASGAVAASPRFSPGMSPILPAGAADGAAGDCAHQQSLMVPGFERSISLAGSSSVGGGGSDAHSASTPTPFADASQRAAASSSQSQQPSQRVAQRQLFGDEAAPRIAGSAAGAADGDAMEVDDGNGPVAPAPTPVTDAHHTPPPCDHQAPSSRRHVLEMFDLPVPDYSLPVCGACPQCGQGLLLGKVLRAELVPAPEGGKRAASGAAGATGAATGAAQTLSSQQQQQQQQPFSSSQQWQAPPPQAPLQDVLDAMLAASGRPRGADGQRPSHPPRTPQTLMRDAAAWAAGEAVREGSLSVTPYRRRRGEQLAAAAAAHARVGAGMGGDPISAMGAMGMPPPPRAPGSPLLSAIRQYSVRGDGVAGGHVTSPEFVRAVRRALIM